MNILIITDGFLPMPAIKGGAINTLLQKYIKNNQKNKLTIYSINPNIKIENNDYNVEYRYVNDNMKYKIGRICRGIINKIPFINIKRQYIKEVIKDIKIKQEQQKYDLVLLENTPISSIFLNKIFNNKVILHLHNDYLNINTKYNTKIINNCKAILCVSQFIKNRVDTITKTNKTYVLYNGIDIDKYSSKKNKNLLRKKYNLNLNDTIILYIGRILQKKGVEELIKAFNNIDNENIKLLIVGNGEKQYLKKIKKLFNDKIILKNYIPNDEINEIYALSDIGVVPSKCNEAFGLTVIEGIASNLKMIVSNDGAIPEITENQDIIIADKNNLEYEITQALKQIIDEERHFKNYDLKILKQLFDTKVFTDNLDKLLIKLK